MKIFWFVCLIVLVLLLLGLAMYLLIGSISNKMVLSRNGKFKKKIEKMFDKLLQKREIDPSYFDNGFEKLSLISEDNLNLYGFYKSLGHDKLVILAHGYGGNHKEMANFAKIFEKRGYDILAIDHRCHGISEGDHLTMGRDESKDLLLWINKMIMLNKSYKIVLFGLSMGASTVCIAGGENLPQNVVAIIEDCGYDNANHQFESVYFKSKMHFKLIYKIFNNFTKKSMGLDLSNVDASKALKNCKLPVMFIHGTEDDFVPTKMIYSLSQNIPEQRKSLYLAEGAWHAEAHIVNPKKYEKEIDLFLTKYHM